jgi:hypothetical protein
MWTESQSTSSPQRPNYIHSKVPFQIHIFKYIILGPYRAVPITNTIPTIAYTSHTFSHFWGQSTTLFGPLRGSAHHQNHLLQSHIFSHFVGYAPPFSNPTGFCPSPTQSPTSLTHPSNFPKISTYFNVSFIMDGTNGVTTQSDGRYGT